MRAVRYIIFDLDGTLVDSSDGIVESVNYSLEMMNLPCESPERIMQYIGYPLSKMYADFTDADPQELYRHFQTKAADTVVSSSAALAGADQVVRQLKEAGFKLAIGTTKIRSHVDRIVSRFGWDDLFDTWVGGDEVKQVKPAPDAFRLALERLKADAAEAVVVGDTINDIRAAQAVPMKVIGVKSPYGGSDEVRALDPDFFMETISELPSLIENSLT